MLVGPVDVAVGLPVLLPVVVEDFEPEVSRLVLVLVMLRVHRGGPYCGPQLVLSRLLVVRFQPKT